ncbi:hypothetical protein D3C80_1574730 [compost metagenome]
MPRTWVVPASIGQASKVKAWSRSAWLNALGSVAQRRVPILSSQPGISSFAQARWPSRVREWTPSLIGKRRMSNQVPSAGPLISPLARQVASKSTIHCGRPSK